MLDTTALERTDAEATVVAPRPTVCVFCLFCILSLFCYALLGVLSSFAIISTRKSVLVAIL